MAYLKKLGLTNDSKKNEVLLKERVKELEDEVTHLKKRLDELRKAKNTTILKREREVLEVGAPFGRRDSKPSVAPGPSQPPQENSKVHPDFLAKLDDLKKQLDQAEKNHQHQITEASKKYSDVEKNRDDELAKLRKQFASEMETVKKDLVEEYSCDHDIELEALRRKVEELHDTNDALIIENSYLQDKISSLVTELSIKEAQWCENEEKLKLQLQRSWGDKYKEWMEKTEKKIAELQASNNLLRGYLKNQKPTGRDPTGQDKTRGYLHAAGVEMEESESETTADHG